MQTTRNESQTKENKRASRQDKKGTCKTQVALQEVFDCWRQGTALVHKGTKPSTTMFLLIWDVEPARPVAEVCFSGEMKTRIFLRVHQGHLQHEEEHELSTSHSFPPHRCDCSSIKDAGPTAFVSLNFNLVNLIAGRCLSFGDVQKCCYLMSDNFSRAWLLSPRYVYETTLTITVIFKCTHCDATSR